MSGSRVPGLPTRLDDVVVVPTRVEDVIEPTPRNKLGILVSRMIAKDNRVSRISAGNDATRGR